MTDRRSSGVVWLAVWLLVAGTFGYRALTNETGTTAVASVDHSNRTNSSPPQLKPIEKIQVGERVAFAINPTEAFDDSLGTAIHSHAWQKIELRPSEHSRVVLLRPEWWVSERVHADSNTMTISIPEVGIKGDAEILSITPCPRIPSGEGRVVIGTFAHLAPETIRLTINGVAEPIRCTPNHATWSVEARAFVEAQDLQPGHHVLCRDGIYEVASVEHLAEPIEVFNLEVFGQHVYQITTGGMLVHNGTEGDCGVPDFDTARREAFELAGMTDASKVEFSKIDPVTGTVVEFKGPGGAKVGYDGPHATPGPSHDVPHISAQSAGKRDAGGGQRQNFPHSDTSGPTRPSR